MQEQLARHAVVGASSKIKAAQYLRMSSERQEYSIENQRIAIQEYATRHGYEVVSSYSDDGKSGLTISQRKALSQLIKDVVSGECGFKTVLVYDVSRWGRFQDADEAAHYEFLCRANGVDVQYCAEPFVNDGDPLTVIFKSVKRAMAGEYSRDLSVKVAHGQKNVASKGFWIGGSPGYGFRRGIIDQTGRLCTVLDNKELKVRQSVRTRLVLGPREEVETVRYIFALCSEEHLGCRTIAKRLNEAGRLMRGKPWNASTIRRMLHSEKYAGTLVACTAIRRMQRPSISLPKEEWVRVENAHDAIVDMKTFVAAQEAMERRKRRYTEAEVLNGLKLTLKKYGKISGQLLREPDCPISHSSVARKFGSYREGYRQAGYDGIKSTAWLDARSKNKATRSKIERAVIQVANTLGLKCERSTQGTFKLDEQASLRPVILNFLPTMREKMRWTACINEQPFSEFLLMVRMDEHNSQIRDYYLMPTELNRHYQFTLTPQNEAKYGEFRHDTLSKALGQFALVSLGDLL